MTTPSTSTSNNNNNNKNNNVVKRDLDDYDSLYTVDFNFNDRGVNLKDMDSNVMSNYITRC